MNWARYWKCDHCNLLVQETGDVRSGPDSALLVHKCPRVDCRGSMKAIDETRFSALIALGLSYFVLNADEFLSACSGFGLPDEIDASKNVVDTLLSKYKIVDVRVRQGGNPKRTILDCLILEDGSTLHVAAGGDGPTIYRITRGPGNGRFGFELPANSEDHTVQCQDKGVPGEQAAAGVQANPSAGDNTRIPPANE